MSLFMPDIRYAYTSHDVNEGDRACAHAGGFRPKSLPCLNREHP
jgi:hypothetical protein